MGEVATGSLREVLICEIGGGRYAFPSVSIREILRAATVAPLPRAPGVVEGALNIRGEIVPVLDIRGRLRLPSGAIEVSDHLVVVALHGRSAAVRVDRAVELAGIEPEAIEHAGGLGPAEPGADEVARTSDGLLVFVDLAALVAADELDPGGVDSPEAGGRRP